MNRISGYFWPGWMSPNQQVYWQEFACRVASPIQVSNVPKGNIPIIVDFSGDFKASSLQKLLKERNLYYTVIYSKKFAIIILPLDDVGYC